jgi:coatomer protein complex subunit alpha (xenin)
LQRNAQDSAPGANTLPAVPFTLSALVDFLKAGYRYFHKGKFEDARKSFDSIVHSIPLVVVDTRSEEMEVKQLLDICREYITALRLQSERKDGKASGTEPKRLAELAAYFTNCKLQPAHLALALDVAMSSACVLPPSSLLPVAQPVFCPRACISLSRVRASISHQLSKQKNEELSKQKK